MVAETKELIRVELTVATFALQVGPNPEPFVMELPAEPVLELVLM